MYQDGDNGQSKREQPRKESSVRVRCHSTMITLEDIFDGQRYRETTRATCASVWCGVACERVTCEARSDQPDPLARLVPHFAEEDPGKQVHGRVEVVIEAVEIVESGAYTAVEDAVDVLAAPASDEGAEILTREPETRHLRPHAVHQPGVRRHPRTGRERRGDRCAVCVGGGGATCVVRAVVVRHLVLAGVHAESSVRSALDVSRCWRDVLAKL